MANKPAYSVYDQIDLLKHRGLLFKDEASAHHYLSNISYYRLKGYWWDMQDDVVNHTFKKGSVFEDVIERYNFDRHLRLILFDAIERIEIALRTQMIYQMSMSYKGLWYLNPKLFQTNTVEISGVTDTLHQHTLRELKRELNRSQEIFIKDHRKRSVPSNPDAWKILEVASMGTLSKLYKSINVQLPEKSRIANEMGLVSHSELSSWLEALTYVRNIIAHHSRIWSRTMVKKPVYNLLNPKYAWLNSDINSVQIKKPFLIISTMIYLCNKITPGHQIRKKLFNLFDSNPNVPIYKLGFLNNWQSNPLWIR